jgi:nucleoside-diphosphate-sugar epimerase
MTHSLVTGAAGFLGYHLARALSSRQDMHVTCVDDFSRGEDDEAYRALRNLDNVTCIEADLCDLSSVARLPSDLDFVYHLAALNGTQNFYERPMHVLRACTLPTLNLLEKYASLPSSRPRFIFAGTSEAYASTVTRFSWPVPTAEDVPLSIDDPQNPRWSYAVSKMHGEVAVNQTGRTTGLPVTVIRYHNAYGPRMGDKHVIPDFLARARHNRFELYGHADTRSFLYVDDAVRATMMVAESPNCIGETINIGSEEEFTIEELGIKIMQVIGRNENIVLHPSPAGSVKRRAPDVSKLQSLTKFERRVSLEEGLLATARYYLNDQLAGPLRADPEYFV